MSADADILEPYRQLLEAGFPKWQIASQVRKHIEGLEALPPDTENREAAIVLANEFLALLEDEPEGRAPE